VLEGGLTAGYCWSLPGVPDYFDSSSITLSSSSSAPTSRKNFSNLRRPLAPTLLSSSVNASSTVLGGVFSA
jgi:hypothetical protein